MFVGTKEVSLSFFLFCCSASSLAFASSVEMMFLIFALEGKKIIIFKNKNNKIIFKKGNRQRNYPKQKDLGVVIALLLYLKCFLREEAAL